MPRTAGRARNRTLATLATLATLPLLLAAAPSAHAALPIDPGSLLPGVPSTGGGASAHCPGAHRNPARMTSRRARAVLLCALNRARRAHGLAPFAPIRPLRVAASRHAVDMARHHYFAHVSLGGRDPLSRLRAAGWHGTAYGEAIAWGCGTRSTPRATVRAWLDSPPHRAIVLSPVYRQAGIGAARRAPSGGCRGGTWVLDAARG